MEFYREVIRYDGQLQLSSILSNLDRSVPGARAGCLRAIYIFARNICASFLDRNEGKSNDGIRMLVKGRLEREWILTRAIRRADLKTSLSRDICEYLDVTWT